MISKKSYPKPKRRNGTPLIIILFLSPYFVGFTSDSSSAYAELSFGAGGGKYVYHDCSGTHEQPFLDAGAYIGKKFEAPFRVGLSMGGWNGSRGGSSMFAFPDLALDWQNFSVGTTGLRLGNREQWYIEGRWLDQPPYWSGKGFLRAGLGGRFGSSETHFWAGVNAIPYNSLGFASQIEMPLSPSKFLFLNGRIGSDEKSKLLEYGFSLGMKFIYR